MTGGGSSIPEVQALLRVLAAGRNVVEIGTAGGLLVKDDLTPARPVEGDAAREFLRRDPRLAAVEILTTSRSAVIVAVRR